MPLSPTTRRDIFKQESANTDIVLITITHPSWKDEKGNKQVVRLSTHETQLLKIDPDTQTPLYGTVGPGKKKFWYCPMQATLPNSTDEQTPEGRLVFSNVTREVAKYLKMVDKEYPKLTVEVVNSASPEDVDMRFPDLDLQTATWNADTVEITVKSDIAANEPSPWLRFSLAYFPNMVQ